MRSLNLFRKFRGYVEFQSKTGNYNKFLSDALENGLNIWDTEIIDGYIFKGKAYWTDYKWIEENAAKYNMEIEILKTKGVILRTSKVKGIYSMLLGFILAVLIVTILSQFIWKIDIIGDESVNKEQLLSLIAESGIKVGTTGKGLDLRNIEQVIMSKTDNLAWIGISRKGTTVYVDVRERILPQKLSYNDEPCNIIAFCDGFIKSASVYKGKLEVSEQSSVKKGDVLVSGAYSPGEDATGMVYTHATADIIAECPVTKTFYLPLNTTEKQRTDDIINRKYLKIGQLQIPLFFASRINGDYICESEKHPVNVFDVSLPIEIITTKYTKTVDVNIDNSQNKDAIMDEMIQNYETKIHDSTQILSKDEHRSEENGMYIATVNYVLEMNIAQEEIIFVK